MTRIYFFIESEEFFLIPLRLHVGLQKKVRSPDGCNSTASCHVELDVDRHLMDRDPKSFRREAEQAFDACRNAVEAEITRQWRSNRTSQPSAAAEKASVTDRANGRSFPSQIRILQTST